MKYRIPLSYFQPKKRDIDFGRQIPSFYHFYIWGHHLEKFFQWKQYIEIMLFSTVKYIQHAMNNNSSQTSIQIIKIGHLIERESFVIRRVDESADFCHKTSHEVL